MSNFWERYIAYLKDNPEGYWFKRKLYGWGWTPATWQGWAVTFGFIAFVIAHALRFEKEIVSNESVWKEFILTLIVAGLLFAAILYRTGEPPKWMFGFPKEKDKDKNELDKNH